MSHWRTWPACVGGQVCRCAVAIGHPLCACACVSAPGAKDCAAVDLWAESGSDEETIGPVTAELSAVVPPGDVKFIRLGNCTTT